MNIHRSFDHLTPRETSILDLIVQGSTSKDAAIALGISPRTVESHRAHIMQKMDAKNLADLVRITVQEQMASGRY